MTRSTQSVGQYAANEKLVTITAEKPAGTVACIWCHGYGVDASSARDGPHQRVLAEIAARGFTVLAADLGGTTTWGNDTSIARVDDVLNYAVTGLGVRSDAIVLAGESMGTLTALNVAWRNTNRVYALWLLDPIVDLRAFHDQNPALAPAIWAAYGGLTGFNTGLPTHDPRVNQEKLRGISAKVRLEVATDDELIDPTWCTDLGWSVDYEIPVVATHPGRHADIIQLDPTPAADWLVDVGELDHGISPLVVRDSNLDALGAAIGQSPARTVEDRWLQLVRDSGVSATLNYLGGDVTDCFVSAGGNVTWVGSDWFDGVAIDADDTYAGTALPIRNGAVLENPTGTFSQQIYRFGTSGIWLSANLDGGLPPNTHWWAIAALNDGGTNRILCWHVQSDAPSPYGSLIDSHIVSLNAFGTYSSHIATGLGTAGFFWVDGVYRDTSFTYIYGEQFIPPYDANTGQGQPNYGQGDLSASYTLKRVARVATGSLLTVASWTFWNGTTWVAGASNATPMVDTSGNQIRGDAGVTKLADGTWLMAAHQLIDKRITVYKSTQPQGPWTPTCRVPAPTQGHVFASGVQIGQLVKLLPSAALPASTPANVSIAVISRNTLGPTDAFADRNIRRYAPQFIAIPNDTPLA